MKKDPSHQHKIFEACLRLIVSWKYNEAIVGDCIEHFRERAQKKGKVKARFWLLFLFITSLPDFAKKSVFWSGEMILNYLKLTFRNIKRHKSFSFINLTGLAVGLVCSVLIFLWVQGELSFDRFHKKADRIHRVEEPSNLILTRNTAIKYFGEEDPMGKNVEFND